MEKLASISEIESVEPHPNADRLDFALVNGYRCIVGKGSFAPGDRCVFIAPDSCLPMDAEAYPWAQPSLKYVSQRTGRVKAAKLRGEWSMGLVLGGELADGAIGDDVSEVLGVTKYEPPLPTNLSARGALPFGMPRTDEDRWQARRRDIEGWIGQPCVVTLKIDGSSITVYARLRDGVADTGVCSRSLDLRLDDNNQWTRAEITHNVRPRLAAYAEKHDVSLALRGEVYGLGIQSMAHNPHSKLDLGVAFYSCLDIETGNYFGPDSPHWYEKVCEALSLPAVPVLERGHLSWSLIERYDSELESLATGEPFEGVVIKGAFGSFKVINKHYDAKK